MSDGRNGGSESSAPYFKAVDQNAAPRNALCCGAEEGDGFESRLSTTSSSLFATGEAVQSEVSRDVASHLRHAISIGAEAAVLERELERLRRPVWGQAIARAPREGTEQHGLRDGSGPSLEGSSAVQGCGGVESQHGGGVDRQHGGGDASEHDLGGERGGLYDRMDVGGSVPGQAGDQAGDSVLDSVDDSVLDSVDEGIFSHAKWASEARMTARAAVESAARKGEAMHARSVHAQEGAQNDGAPRANEEYSSNVFDGAAGITRAPLGDGGLDQSTVGRCAQRAAHTADGGAARQVAYPPAGDIFSDARRAASHHADACTGLRHSGVDVSNREVCASHPRDAGSHRSLEEIAAAAARARGDGGACAMDGGESGMKASARQHAIEDGGRGRQQERQQDPQQDPQQDRQRDRQRDWKQQGQRDRPQYSQ
eukprot:5787555-Pleurochrysis_carterae.AAC.2